MTVRIDREHLLFLLEGDQALLGRLREGGFIPSDDGALGPVHAETARVAATLVHELEINWPGVEVVLRMRADLVATRRQVADLLALLREQASRGE